jgi:glycosyltransferase involved in cell wall biosynthesis
MRDVLVIAYYFPPLGMGGVQRTFKFCKYLPRFGWNPIVLTVKDIAYFAHDFTPLREVPTEIYRTESLDPLRLALFFRRQSIRDSGKRWSSLLSWFLIPDSKSPWLPFLINGAKALMREREISLIFATFPPATSLVAGTLLKKHCGRPFVMDLRDPLRYGLSQPTFLHSSLIGLLTRKLVEAADGIVTAYPPAELEGAAEKVTVIPNGFDPEDFSERDKMDDRFLIVHTGTLTRKRNGLPFLRTLRELVESGRIDRSRVRVKLVGWIDPVYADAIESEGLADMVETIAYASHGESVAYLMSSSLLWLPAGAGEIPGKAYEYLGSGKPILATAPEGDCAELIRTTGSGIVSRPDDQDGIGAAIVHYYTLWRNGDLPRGRQRRMEMYNRIDQTRVLTRLFDSVVR